VHACSPVPRQLALRSCTARPPGPSSLHSRRAAAAGPAALAPPRREVSRRARGPRTAPRSPQQRSARAPLRTGETPPPRPPAARHGYLEHFVLLCVAAARAISVLHRPRLPLGGPCEAPLKRGIRGSSGRNNVTTESRLAARRRQPWLASSRASSRSTSTGRAPPPAARARHPHPKSPAPWAHRGRNRRPRPRAACAWRCLPRDAPAHPRRASRPYRQVSLHVRPAPEGPRRTVSSWAAAPEPAPARVRGRARATGS